jgi:hypothetical protein
MTKKTTTVYVFRDRSWDAPGSLVAFVEWANGLLAEVPDEYKATARVDVESEYDSTSVEFSASYNRPETDEEAATREARINFLRDDQKARELAELRRLLTKYGQEDPSC